MSKLKKETREKRETERLFKIFQDLDANKLAACEALIYRAAFITVELQECEDRLRVNGWTEEYQNGQNQRGLKKSADAEVHISLTKNLNAIMKQLLDLVPAAARKNKLEELRGK